MKQLEDGVTPISMRDHVVILGWNSRTPEIVAELLNARGRLARFLERGGTRRLHIVVVAESDVAQHRRTPRAHLGLRIRRGDRPPGRPLGQTHAARS